jgi:hypothetical protein
MQRDIQLLAVSVWASLNRHMAKPVGLDGLPRDKSLHQVDRIGSVPDLNPIGRYHGRDHGATEGLPVDQLYDVVLELLTIAQATEIPYQQKGVGAAMVGAKSLVCHQNP